MRLSIGRSYASGAGSSGEFGHSAARSLVAPVTGKQSFATQSANACVCANVSSR
jgi:hypothetical protein